MYDAPIKFKLTQHFGSANVAFSQDLAKIHKSWPIYTLVHDIHCLYKSICTPHNSPHTNSYNTDLFSESMYLIGKRYT